MCRASTRLIALIVLAASLTVPLPGMKRRSVCIFGSDIFIPNALHGKVYDLPDGTFHLPVFDHMKPVGQVYATALNIPPQDFEEYFPGVRSRVEWFGIDYQGYFWIRNPGEYRFSLTSDDGATLMIDDRMIINNDGLHPPKEERGKITLTAGSHYMRIEYFQGIRTLVALVLQIAPPEGNFHLFDTRDYPPPLEMEYNAAAPGGSFLNTIKPARRAALDALETHPLPHDFEYGMRTLSFPTADGDAQYEIAFEVPKSSLTPKPVPLRETRAVRAQLLALVRDAEGNAVATVNRELAADISDLQPVLTWQYPLHLGRGFYTIESAVFDWNGDRSSAQVAYLYNRPRRGLALSDVVLIRQIEDDRSGARDPFQTQGKRVTPWLASVLGSGATPYVYFIVAPDKAIREKPTLTVQLVRNGEVAATQTAPLPPPDASGRIPMLIGTAAQSGSWEVQIGVVQGGETTAQRVAYTIR
ncbi:MAG TPA: PA14 domain-containing protein [Bryobacteraceae bacterium]|nr:PA14 domain-containing protein [Bryobacteraceae bacterium]